MRLFRDGAVVPVIHGWRPSLDGLITLVAAIVLSACAAPQHLSYSLQDPEIFVATRPHPINVVVVEMEDHRPLDEKEWAIRRKLPVELPVFVTRRMVDHLRVSGVFNSIRLSPEPKPLEFPGQADRLTEQGMDAVLVGHLAHFYGRTGPDRFIEGYAQFTNLRLTSLHTGRILWQGEAEKLLRRQEKAPGRDRQYASEALRGAMNQLSLEWAHQTYAPLAVYGKDRLPVNRWRVGLMRPVDLRPPQERSIRERKLQGNRNYFLYRGSIPEMDRSVQCGFFKFCPFADVAARQWAGKLRSSSLFGMIRIVENQPVTAESRKNWAEAGLDGIITSELDRGSAAVLPLKEAQPFPIWSGGMGYPRLFRATAFTRLLDVRLIDTRTGRIIWKGEAEYGIDRGVGRWESPSRFLQEALTGMLNRLTGTLLKSLPFNGESLPPQ